MRKVEPSEGQSGDQMPEGVQTPDLAAGGADRTSATAMLLSFRTRRWRWYWAIVSTLTGALLAVALMLAAAAATHGLDTRGETEALLRPGSLSDYIVILMGWTLLGLAGLLTLRVAKGDAMACAFTSCGTFPVRDFVKTAAAILIVYVLGALPSYIVTPQDFSRPERAPDFYAWLIFGLFVILVQSLGEEIFFRGFLFRVWGAVFPFPWVAPALIMAVFISIHIPNPDMQRDLATGVSVFISGEIIAYAALLRTKALAASWGLHWGNNIYAFFLMATAPMGDTDAAIFVYTDPVYAAGGTHALDPAAYGVTLASFLSIAALLFWDRSPLCLPKRAVVGAPPSGHELPSQPKDAIA